MHTYIYTSAQTANATGRTVAEQSHQDYLRISQDARTAALAARRATSTAFWAAVAGSIHSLGKHTRAYFSEHSSVRLGAGHHIQHLEG
jgi:hypothetical protein